MVSSDNGLSDKGRNKLCKSIADAQPLTRSEGISEQRTEKIL